MRDHDEDESERIALAQIASYLIARGSQLSDFGLPQLEQRPREVEIEISYFTPRQNYLRSLASDAVENLNHEQLEIYHHIITLCRRFLRDNNLLNPIFIDGKAGRGKTYLVNAICNTLRSEGKIVVVVGTTALSALLYERGRTAHSTFGIPVVPVSSNYYYFLC